MSLQLNKFLARLKIISLYGFSNLSTLIAQLVLSFIIIRMHSVDLWGEYVEIWLWLQLIVLFSYFGNKNYLLKVFSESPSQVFKYWTSNFLSRGVLFLISLVFICTIPLFTDFLWPIIAWAFLLFFNQSFEVLILYRRDFKFSLFSELSKNIFTIIAVLAIIEQLSVHSLLLCIILGLVIKALANFIFYFRNIKTAPLELDFPSLKRSVPFFIPMVLGTIRTKIDAYYGTVFFNKTDLSKYQIFITMIGLVQVGATYVINPFIKTFFRIGDNTRRRIEKQFVLLGLLAGVLTLPLLYFVSSGLYNFTFSNTSYLLAFLFICTLFIHLLLINEFYKKNKQTTVAVIIAITAIIQISLGYVVIDAQQIEGALFIKTLGQWLMIIALYIYKQRTLS